MYKKVSTDMNFVDREKETEKFWEDNHIFEKSMEDREGCPQYMLLAATMFNKATRGDVRAAEFIRDLTGQQPVTSLDRARTKLMNAQAEQIKKQGDPSKELTKLDLLLRAMDTVAGDDSGTN